MIVLEQHEHPNQVLEFVDEDSVLKHEQLEEDLLPLRSPRLRGLPVGRYTNTCR